MSILFYCKWSNQNEWLNKIKKVFKKKIVYTLEDKPDFAKIKFAIIWELPNHIYKKLVNVKLLFSLGAGVDHILNIKSYNNIPIIRLRDPSMAERMSNHVLSQILFYQLDLKTYINSQKKHQWRDDKEPTLNSNLCVGILGVGFLGSRVGADLAQLGYKVQGFKNSKIKKNYLFTIYYQKKDLNKFIKTSDIIISILPATLKTFNFIDKDFLKLMKKSALLINVGRGASINEKDLILHLKNNKLFKASLDVFKKEPLPKNHPFWQLSNVIITPHVASLTVVDTAVDYIYQKYLEFNKKNYLKSDVNLKKGY